MSGDESYDDWRDSHAEINAELADLLALAQAATLGADTAVANAHNAELRRCRAAREDWPGVTSQNLKLDIDRHLRGTP